MTASPSRNSYRQPHLPLSFSVGVSFDSAAPVTSEQVLRHARNGPDRPLEAALPAMTGSR